MHRRDFLTVITATALGGWRCVLAAAPAATNEAVSTEKTSPMNYLRELTAAVINAASVQPGQSVAGSPPNTSGGTLIRPGGRADYPSCWVRDFTMSLDCGLIAPKDILHHVRFFARSQNGPEERKLKSGGIIPPFAIPDHVNFDGGAVFYPGTYDAGENQGGEPWGTLPPVDDHYYFVHAAYRLFRLTHDGKFLGEHINGLPLIERLIRAFDAPAVDDNTGAVTTNQQRRAVGFGFVDSVYMTGSLLIPTLLRYQAAKELAKLCVAGGRTEDAPRFSKIAQQIVVHLPKVFAFTSAQDGWLKAATGISGQPDVWGTLLALRMKVLPADPHQHALAAIVKAVRGGTIEYAGAVRQVPTDLDAGPHTAWQRSLAGFNTYQNGAYWHTATGWLMNALRGHDDGLAQAVFARYLAHLRAGDFRKGEKFGAPWECLGRNGAGRQNPVYMTSVTVPLSVL